MSQSRDKCPQRNGSSWDTFVESYLTTRWTDYFLRFFRTDVRGHRHSDPKNICDTRRPQDVSTYQIGDSKLKYYSRTEARGQGHSDQYTVCDTLQPQDVSTQQIWVLYLKLYNRYAPSMINLK